MLQRPDISSTVTLGGATPVVAVAVSVSDMLLTTVMISRDICEKFESASVFSKQSSVNIQCSRSAALSVRKSAHAKVFDDKIINFPCQSLTEV
jgi:hypothetical protein